MTREFVPYSAPPLALFALLILPSSSTAELFSNFTLFKVTLEFWKNTAPPDVDDKPVVESEGNEGRSVVEFTRLFRNTQFWILTCNVEKAHKGVVELNSMATYSAPPFREAYRKGFIKKQLEAGRKRFFKNHQAGDYLIALKYAIGYC